MFVHDLDITKGLETNEVSISKPVSLAYNVDPAKNVSNSQCISRNLNLDSIEWSNELCETKILESEDSSNPAAVCNCKTLNPTTIINDIKSIFEDSKLSTIFSEEGALYFHIYI